MFGHFQTILNELKGLGMPFDNYDHIHKILRSLPRQWRPQETALRASKNLDNLSIEELIGILKVQKIELQQDNEGNKGKSLALIVHKTKKPSSSKSLPKASSKVVSVDNSSDEYEYEEANEDDLSLICRNIRKM